MYRILIVDEKKRDSMEIGQGFQEEGKVSGKILSENERKGIKFYQKIYTEIKKSMCENVENPDYVMHIFEAFSNAVVSYGLTVEEIRRDCFDMASAVYFSYIHGKGRMTESRLDELMKNIISADASNVCEITGTFLFRMFGKDKASMHDIISKVLQYIDEHLTESISVSRIAVQFYITPNYLSRLFKKTVGEGCNEYIVRKRIEKAQDLLESTNMKTGKIACMVGYRDTNYF